MKPSLEKKTSKRLLGGVGGGSGSAALSSDGFSLKPSAPAPVARPGGFTLKTGVPTAAGPTVIPDAPKAHADGNFQALADVLGTLNTNLNSAITSGLAYATNAEELARKRAEALAEQYPKEEEEKEEECPEGPEGDECRKKKEEEEEEKDKEEDKEEDKEKDPKDPPKNPEDDDEETGPVPDDKDPDVDGSKSLKSVTSSLNNIVSNKDKSNNYTYPESERSSASAVLNKVGNNKRLKRHLESIYRRNAVRDRALNVGTLASNVTVTNEDGEEVPLSSLPSTSSIYKNWYSRTVYGDEPLSALEYEEIKPTLVNQKATDIKRQDKSHTQYQVNEWDKNKTITLAGAGKLISEGNVSAATQNIQELLDELNPLLPSLTSEKQAELKKGLVEGVTVAFLNSNNKTKDEEQLLDALKGLFIGPANNRNIVVKKDGQIVLGDDNQPLTIANEKLRWINQEGGEQYIKNIIADVKSDLIDNDNNNDKFDKHEGEKRSNEEFAKEVLPLLQAGKITQARKKIAELSKTYQIDAIKGRVDPDIMGEVVGHYNDQIKDYLSTDDATIADEQIALDRKLLAAATNPTKLYEVERGLEQMENKYSHNKDVITFVRKTRESLAKLKATSQSPYHSNIKSKLESLTSTFMKTAKDDSSYDGLNDFPEINMTTEARIKGWQIASTIVDEGIKKNLSFTQIAEQLDKALTRENLGLVYKSEKPEEVTAPTYKNLGEFNDSHKWLRGDIKNPQPNDLKDLNKAINNKQPMFPKHTINTQVRNILTSIKTDPTNPKIDKRIRLLLKASGKPLSEFFIEQLTKNGETVSEELIEVLEVLDKVKL